MKLRQKFDRNVCPNDVLAKIFGALCKIGPVDEIPELTTSGRGEIWRNDMRNILKIRAHQGDWPVWSIYTDVIAEYVGKCVADESDGFGYLESYYHKVVFFGEEDNRGIMVVQPIHRQNQTDWDVYLLESGTITYHAFPIER